MSTDTNIIHIADQGATLEIDISRKAAAALTRYLGQLTIEDITDLGETGESVSQLYFKLRKTLYGSSKDKT